VERGNSALRRNERLEFKAAGQDAVSVKMIWSATGQAQTQ